MDKRNLNRVISDLILLIVCYTISFYYISPDFYKDISYYLFCLSGLVFWTFASNQSLLYEEYRSRTFTYEFVLFVKTLVNYTLYIAVVCLIVFPTLAEPRTFFSLSSLLIFIFLGVNKYISRWRIAMNRAKGRNVKKVLIVGTIDSSDIFKKIVNENQQFGYSVIGLLTDSIIENSPDNILGDIDSIENVLQNHEIDDVVIALPLDDNNKIGAIISSSEKMCKRIRIIPDHFIYGSGNFKISNFASIPLITIRTLPLDDNQNKLFKRLCDITISFLFFLFIFIWIFPVIALLIKASSKGPIFFKQIRWGLNNEKFYCYKFRTMKTDSKDLDENGKYLQASKGDVRITKIGRILRRTNIDELPQFINVLFGNMSIVGPRPHPIPLNLESKDVIENYLRRHLVKPGITGWAQVNGSRGETKTPGAMQRRVNLDLWYIENWNIWLDFQIIIQTIVNMVKGDKNAY